MTNSPHNPAGNSGSSSESSTSTIAAGAAPQESGLDSRGLLYGLLAYGMWGAFPLFFRMVREASAVEVVAHRVVFALLTCLVFFLLLRRRFQWSAYRDRKAVLWTLAASALIAVNWGIYVYGVNSGRVVETSLGYFINPLATIALGVLFLGERLRTAQWIAVGLGTVAVVVLAFSAGGLPWIALSLAVSFATYGLAKNRIGRSVDALTGMTAETAILFPLAIVVDAVLWGRGSLVLGHSSVTTTVVLVLTGTVTVIPLLAFAAAARRIPLSTLGLMQYLAPVFQFLVGWAVFHEPMPLQRWIGFAVVWAALVILTWDTLRARRLRSAR